MKPFLGYVFRGQLPFALTKGERVFIGVLQAIDCALVYWMTK